MAKSKKQPSVQNRHIYSRASYLYQAATLFASQAHSQGEPGSQTQPTPAQDGNAVPAEGWKQPEAQRQSSQSLSRLFIKDLRAMSLKAQIRQSPAMKRSICKFCDTLQVEGRTCWSQVENPSRGARKKPWADVLVIKCTVCENVKRFPVSAPRQRRKSQRGPDQGEAEGEKCQEDVTMA